ncbi:MAG: hypothetical protein HKO13_06985 [Sphingomonas sp.]|nr:hypothetical protein [Sphingomonas sp.]RZV50956.1 MAG: hypothetical protein EX258_04545 [Sphingomonadaceae bacterium]
MEADRKKKKRFVIKVGDTYYLTDGKLLRYNMKEADAEPNENWRKKMKEGVEDMKVEYQKEYDSVNTWYPAVDFTNVAFSGVQTGDDD